LGGPNVKQDLVRAQQEANETMARAVEARAAEAARRIADQARADARAADQAREAEVRAAEARRIAAQQEADQVRETPPAQQEVPPEPPAQSGTKVNVPLVFTIIVLVILLMFYLIRFIKKRRSKTLTQFGSKILKMF